MSTVIAKLLSPLLRRFGPALAVELLCSFDPEQLADRLEPYLTAAMNRMPSEWRPVFAMGLRKLAELAAALAE